MNCYRYYSLPQTVHFISETYAALSVVSCIISYCGLLNILL